MLFATNVLSIITVNEITYARLCFIVAFSQFIFDN